MAQALGSLQLPLKFEVCVIERIQKFRLESESNILPNRHPFGKRQVCADLSGAIQIGNQAESSRSGIGQDVRCIGPAGRIRQVLGIEEVHEGQRFPTLRITGAGKVHGMLQL